METRRRISRRSGRMTRPAYAQQGGTRCPYCLEYAVETASRVQEDEKGIIRRRARCLSCGERWDETYRLTGWEA